MTKIVKIGLNSGHAWFTAGKRCLKSIDPKETREWVLNDRIAVKIEEKLKNYDGVEVYRLDDRTGQRYTPLKERTDMANSLKLDFVDDIHHNAGIRGGSGGGVMVIRHHITGQATKNYQEIMYDKLIKHTGLKGNRSNPKPTQNLHMCRETNMPTLTVEHGFMDSTTDTPIILTEKFAEQCANAHVEFYVEVFNLKKKKIPVVGGEPGMMYRVRKEWTDATTQIGAYTVLGNAKELSDNNNGYSVYDKSGKLVYPIEEVTMQLTYNRTLYRGVKGDDVKKLQIRLVELGFDPNGIDGSFGGGTDRAVRSFQKEYKIQVDGRVGRETINTLNSGKKKVSKANKYEILRPNTQTTVVKIPHKNIKEIKTIIANNKSKSESLQSMKDRTNVDLIINGGIYYWSDKYKDNRSLNLLVNEGKTIVAGTYSRYSLMTEKDGSYEFDWYNWNLNRRDAIGGSPALVVDGRINLDRGTLTNDIHSVRHPRSAVGMNKDYFYMVVIDGRKPSAKLYGMTNLELANFMLKELKCEYAIGFDGGWSSTVIGNEGVLNKSYTGRKIHNAIGVVLA